MTILETVIESGHSRYPVINEKKKKVEGILLAKDLLPLLSINEEVNLDSIMRGAKVVPETKRADSLLEEFKKDKSHLAVVIDEYGEICGLVTIEDILEELVGEIEDEHDIDDLDLIQVSEKEFIADAKIEIDEFEEKFEINLNESSVETLGGYMTKKLGILPKVGDKIIVESIELVVTAADKRRIKKLASQLLLSLRKYFEPVLFGSIGVLSFAPFSFKYALVVSYTYLIYKLFRSNDNRNLNNLFLWSFGYWGIGTSWIIVSIYYYGNVVFWINFIILNIINWLHHILFSTNSIVKRVIINKSNNLLLFVPFILILVEFGRYYFLGDSHGYCQDTFLDTPYEILYGLIGVSGLSLLLYLFVASNVVLYSNKIYLLAFNLFLFISLMSPNIFQSNKSDGDVVNLAIIQPSTDPFKKFDNDYLKNIEEEFVSLSSQAAEKADILVWPEAPLPYISESTRSQDLIKNVKKPLNSGFFSYQD